MSTSSSDAFRDFVDTVSRDGPTTTLSARGKSVTIGPKPRTDDGAEGGKRLILGGNPDDAIWVPAEGDFEAADAEFLPDPHLGDVAEALIAARRMSAADARVLYRWKSEGGETNGKATLGKCVKLSGHAKHFANAEYLVWVAADHCRALDFTEWELEALLFHELLHVEVGVTKEGEPSHKVRGHDAELFLAEFRHYGFWRSDLERVGEAVRQVPLDLR